MFVWKVIWYKNNFNFGKQRTYQKYLFNTLTVHDN